MTMHRLAHDDRPHLRTGRGHGRRWTPTVSGDEPVEQRRRRSATDAIRGLVELAVGPSFAPGAARA
jgi:hypothetical protein